MNEKISVIIPIYKVETYLDRCITSVVKQTYENLEIILVDDGSPDNCPQMCDDWAEKDDRIKVIHKENGGLSDARNAGMKVMTGEYVFFVDSDDWIHRDTLKLLKKYLKENNADIVECKAKVTYEDCEDVLIDEKFVEINTYDTKRAMYALLRENPLKQTVWNKLYKKNIIEETDFEIGKYHEDEFWTYQVIDRAKKVVYVDLELYYYYQRKDSIMGQAFSLKRIDAIEGRYRRFQMIKEKYPEFVFIAKENILFLIIYFGQQAMNATNDDKVAYFKEIEHYIKIIKFSKKDLKTCSFMQKLWIIGSIKNLYFICKVRNIMKIGIY